LPGRTKFPIWGCVLDANGGDRVFENVLGLKGANSVEVDPKTKYPVINIMPDQVEYLKKHQYGGTIRLGPGHA